MLVIIHIKFVGFLPSHGNSVIPPEHHSFNDEHDVPNMTMSSNNMPLVDGITETEHSPNNNTMISSQILGSTPLSQIGCPLPIDQYTSQLGN